jgi:hypothetical protein
MAGRPDDGEGGYELQNCAPGHDPGQAVHDEQLASLSDAQLDGVAQAIKEFMDRKQAEQVDGGIATVIPFRPKRKRRPKQRLSKTRLGGNEPTVGGR